MYEDLIEHTPNDTVTVAWSDKGQVWKIEYSSEFSYPDGTGGYEKDSFDYTQEYPWNQMQSMSMRYSYLKNRVDQDAQELASQLCEQWSWMDLNLMSEKTLNMVKYGVEENMKELKEDSHEAETILAFYSELIRALR